MIDTTPRPGSSGAKTFWSLDHGHTHKKVPEYMQNHPTKVLYKHQVQQNHNETICETPHVEICQATPAVHRMESLEISLPSPSPKILTNHGTRHVQTAWRAQRSKTRSHQRTTQSPEILKLTLADLCLKAVLKPHQTLVSLSVLAAAGQDKTAK